MVTVLICLTLPVVGRLVPGLGDFQAPSFDSRAMAKVLPLSVVFVTMISLNNLCLKHVGVAFYYIGRSLTTVFNVLMTRLILGRSKTHRSSNPADPGRVILLAISR